MTLRIAFIFILIFGLLVSVYLLGQRTGFFSKADISAAPQDIRISNVSDNSFTVSWITAKPVNGFVSFGGSESLGETAQDDRDSSGPKMRQTHHVTLKNLDPDTVYFYKITNGDTAKQKTAPTTQDTPPLADPIFGKVVRSDQSPETEAIIYSIISGSTLLSSYTREDGNFLITLNNARTSDLSFYITVKDSDAVDFKIKTAGEAMEAKVSAESRKTAVQLTLRQPQVTRRAWPADFNNDSKINVVDYALHLKERFTK